MPEKNIIDKEISQKLENLNKDITSLEFQNKLMAGIHASFMILCLSFLLSSWQDESLASAIMTLSVIIAELIDMIVFKKLTNKNTYLIKKARDNITNLINKETKKGQIIDKIV